MKYFLDTEFIEHFKSCFLADKDHHVIDLISIGIISETGSEFYAISTEFDPKEANEWVKQNVISKLPKRYPDADASPSEIMKSQLWKKEDEIKHDLLKYFGCTYEADAPEPRWVAPEGIEIYGYFADYDWVLFCSLFGTMMDLPAGFPMFCMDLKQMMQERGLTQEWKRKVCPDPEGEHDALVDARWNRNLYNAIMKKNENKILSA